MLTMFRRMKRERARRIVLSRREKRGEYGRAIFELADLGVHAIDDPRTKNRSKYVRAVLLMIADKAEKLRKLG